MAELSLGPPDAFSRHSSRFNDSTAARSRRVPSQRGLMVVTALGGDAEPMDADPPAAHAVSMPSQSMQAQSKNEIGSRPGLPMNLAYTDSQGSLPEQSMNPFATCTPLMRDEILYADELSEFGNSHLAALRDEELLGVTSLWLASKYEEIHGCAPCLRQLSYVCCNAYRLDDFIQMELRLLSELNYSLAIPIPETFLKLQCSLLYRDALTHVASGSATSHNPACGCNEIVIPGTPISDGSLPSQLEDHIPRILAVARYVCELTLVHKKFLARKPSMVATGAFVVAERILQCGIVRNIDDPMLWDVIEDLITCCRSPSHVTAHKYSKSSYGQVSRIVATSLPTPPQDRDIVFPATPASLLGPIDWHGDSGVAVAVEGIGMEHGGPSGTRDVEMEMVFTSDGWTG
ncbi:hypothetical protein HDU93_008209 [Gonapodya sp. JEL0774]|nr:hypothetical protein HDU93_008209 [Gonapodya sp. JEL0774]